MSKTQTEVGRESSLWERRSELSLVPPCCRGSHRACLYVRENCLQEQIHLLRDRRRGARSPHRAQVGGSRAGPAFLTVITTAQSRGAATFRPAPSQDDATHTGQRPRPLTQGRVSWIHYQTERRHLHRSPDLPVSAPAWPPNHPEAPKARSCNVCATVAAAAFAPPLRCGRRVFAHTTCVIAARRLLPSRAPGP